MYKNILLIVASTICSVAVFAGLYELLAGYQYDKWREGYKQSGDWYGQLTVPSDNEVLLWEYRPNAVGKKLGVEIKTNEYGFRDVSHVLQKPENKFRIAFIGDSVTLGIGVEAESTFVSLFSAMANPPEMTGNVESLSFSVDSYSGIQVMEMAREKVISFSPDLIVYIMCMNDFDFDHASGQKDKYFKKPGSFFLRVLERVYLKYLGIDYYRHAFNKNGQTVLSDIVRTKALLDEKGIQFRVVIMPVFRFEDSPARYPLTWLHEEITETLLKNNVSVIDLHEPLEAVMPLDAYGFDHWHLNETGHREVAKQLVNALLN